MQKMIELPKIGSEKNGYLSYFEVDREIQFDIKRIYYIYDVKKETRRGMHAHKNLKQLLWCPYGAIEILLDNGNEKKKYLLDAPEKGLIIEEGIWREMLWLIDGSILCVGASDIYNESDYIRDYSEFTKLTKEGYWKHENKF